MHNVVIVMSTLIAIQDFVDLGLQGHLSQGQIILENIDTNKITTCGALILVSTKYLFVFTGGSEEFNRQGA